jgi:hypothetical protein
MCEAQRGGISSTFTNIRNNNTTTNNNKNAKQIGILN